MNPIQSKLFRNPYALLAIVAMTLLAFFLLPPPQKARAGDNKTLTVPTVVGDNVSNNIAQILYVHKQQQVAISWRTAATNWTARFSASVDGSTWQTNYVVVAYGVNAADPARTIVTNITVGGVPMLRLDSVTAVGTINATNTVSYWQKATGEGP